MSASIRDYLPWLLSAITIWMTLLTGNLHRSAWLVGLGNQALWLLWIVVTGTWGLVPLNIALWIVYGRNHLKWRKAEAPAGEVWRVDREGVVRKPERRVVLRAKNSPVKPHLDRTWTHGEA